MPWLRLSVYRTPAARELDAGSVVGCVVACRLTPARAERAHATSAMRALQFFWASLKTACDRERQYKVCESMSTRNAGGPCGFATCAV